MKKKFRVAQEYSRALGGRYESQGAYSGEDFRNRVLAPFFQKKGKNDVLEINLDGLNGYPASFLEEAFGGIAREYPQNEVSKSLEFVSEDNPFVIDDIRSYIKQEYAVT